MSTFLRGLAFAGCLTLLNLIGTVAHAEELITVETKEGAARLMVSDGTNFAFAAAVVNALKSQGVEEVTISVTQPTQQVSKSPDAIYVINYDGHTDKREDCILICVPANTSFKLAATLAESLSTLKVGPVRFLSREAFQSMFAKALGAELP